MALQASAMASTTVIVIAGDHCLCSCCSAWALKAPSLPVMAACWLLSCGSKDVTFLCEFLSWSRPQWFSELLVSNGSAIPFWLSASWPFAAFAVLFLISKLVQLKGTPPPKKKKPSKQNPRDHQTRSAFIGPDIGT